VDSSNRRASPGPAQPFGGLDEAVGRAAATSGQIAVVAVAIDGFAAVGESLGRAAADELLTVLTSRLEKLVVSRHLVTWIGGDSFAVLCDEVSCVDDALVVAGRLQGAVRAPLDLEDRQVRLTASIGVAWEEQPAPTSDLVRDAEVAMHQARARGGACAEIFTPVLRDRAMEHLWIEQELRRALELDELRVVFEPVVTLEAPGYIAGIEACVRWEHPVRGFIPARRFVPIARETNLILTLERWLLTEAFRQAGRCAREIHRDEPPFLAVEVSARHVAQPGFVQFLAGVLDVARLDAAKTILYMRDQSPPHSERLFQTVESLHSLGVRLFLAALEVDPLLSLSHLPVDGFKLGRSLVGGVMDNPATTTIVEAFLEVAEGLSMQAIAEGLDTNGQARRLADLGCRLGAGPLFARPVPQAALPALLARGLPPAGWEPPLPARSRLQLARRTREQRHEEEHRLVTLREATEALGVSANTVRRWADRGLIGTERTRGGHRRFRAVDISAIHQERRGRAVLRCPGLPKGAASVAAGLVERLGAEILSRVAESLYERGSSGWFRSDEAHAYGEQWVQTLASGLRTGEYVDVLASSRHYLRRARLGGASLLECHIALERFTQGIVHMASQQDCPSEDALAVRRLLAGVDHVLLEQV
jgi:diguanylate cyclase (GGDEF)-like protein/excisionase family DNA binding protein